MTNLKKITAGALSGLIGLMSIVYASEKAPEVKTSTSITSSTPSNSSTSTIVKSLDDSDWFDSLLSESFEKYKQQVIAKFKYEKEKLSKLDRLEIPLGYCDDLNRTPYWHWKVYSGSKGKEEPRMKLNVLDNTSDNLGIRADYYTPYFPDKSWQGIYHNFSLETISLDEDTWPKNGIDISTFDCIGFQARGNGKIRLQLTEGYDHRSNAEFPTYFGEIYETIITPESEWKSYMIPFKKLVKRIDFQHTQEEFNQQGLGRCCLIDKGKFDNTLDLKEIHSIEIEFLRKVVFFEENRYIEIKDLYFYKKQNENK